MAEKKNQNEDICPKCGAPLGEVVTTKTGKQLRRCTKGAWNPETKQVDGCDYVKWMEVPPQELDEKCPKCGSPLLLVTTKFGKKAKKCSTNKWDPQTKSATGCDYIQWIGSTKEELDEDCPQCGEKLVMVTTANGKKMKKCSTSGWDPKNRVATGCDYIEWQNDSRPRQYASDGDENFPAEEH